MENVVLGRYLLDVFGAINTDDTSTVRIDREDADFAASHERGNIAVAFKERIQELDRVLAVLNKIAHTSDDRRWRWAGNGPFRNRWRSSQCGHTVLLMPVHQFGLAPL